MHIILTHEQADFDALAALLGASLLNEDAIPVLPRRLNRNVSAFLTLYGAELPFVEARDLPPGPIHTVTLVDTQSLVTLKGMHRGVNVHIVDHHQPRGDLPARWSMTNDRTGACTTLFVEDLRDHNGALNLVHATLLLLGIYEDTGALTYVSTTPRDVRAAAFLLEQGASLRIATEYLNPPLSANQRRLYDRLLATSRTLSIHGQNIMIATADAEDMNEEISSIAHKLRDLMDPDALFLLVNTVDGVRLVARSTSDRVDVSAVAVRFGGGGHDRAAAALIRYATHPSAEEVRRELETMLPQYVRPAITVGHIMSHRPLLIDPDTPAQTAAKLMQRYGYEGYPVVKDGRVIGLLTRRAVDRAVAHKLNLPAASLMEAGSITIHPQDAIEQLQQLMASSGWGQIPVTAPENDQVIGIVTRTDLIKTLARREMHLPGKQNLADRLEAALPPLRLALIKQIAILAREQHLAIYIVGGFVRDLILDRPSLDFDIVVEGDAIGLGRSLAARLGGRVVSHARFGTSKWWIADIRAQLAAHLTGGTPLEAGQLPDSLDLISSRTEFYDYPTALPTVERSSIKLDLHRRDFTMNTMALRLDGRHYGDLYDYWGGVRDLRQGLVRVLHSLSFIDDPTRLLRAVRFEQRFDFQIEERTRQLMGEGCALLRQVSGDRLRHELNLILAEEKAPAMLARLQELSILKAIHPELMWDEARRTPLERLLTQPLEPEWNLPESFSGMPTLRALSYLIWLGNHPANEIARIGDRLRFSTGLIQAIQISAELPNDLQALIGSPPSQIVARLETVPLPLLYGVHLLQPPAEIEAILHRYVTVWQNIRSHTNGDTLRTLGIPPGPAYRTILSTLRSAWLDGKISTTEEEQILVQQLLSNLATG